MSLSIPFAGLDPALPLFEDIQNEKSRLDYGDAHFVDVIHTCGGVLGFWDAIGKADFYPNNGMAPQPGCMNFNKFHFGNYLSINFVLYLLQN